MQHFQSPIGRGPTELDPENVMETQLDLSVLSSALDDCRQGMHLYLGGNVMVHHPVGSKIPRLRRVYEWR